MNKLCAFNLIVLFALVSCTKNSSQAIETKSLIESFSKQVKKKNCMVLKGFGGNISYEGNNFHLYFSCEKTLELNEARKLLVENVESLLEQINANQSITKQLHAIPFDYPMIEMMISFNKNNIAFNPPNIALVYVSDGKVFYSVYNTFTKSLKNIHSETYLKAKGILEHQKNLKECERITGISAADMFSE